MQYREFGKTGKRLSVLGFGGMRFPINDGNYASIDEEKSTEMIKYAVESGVNLIDTAYPYHGTGMANPGQSELFIGRVMKEHGFRDKVYLSTKLPSWLIDSREKMDEILDHQLERLQTDCIDFYLVHGLNKHLWENLVSHGLFEFLDSIKKSMKVKHVGFSFHDDLGTFKKITDAYDWEFCLIQYNYLDVNFQAGEEGIKYAFDKDMGIMIMEPLRGGSLVQGLPSEITDLYTNSEHKRTPVEWALQWLWNQPEVGTVLSGMSELKHVVDNVKYAGRSSPNSFTDDDSKIMDKAQEIFRSRIKVNCTKCGYCMPCPAGVNIPECFSLYNAASLINNTKHSSLIYATFSDSEKATACVECGECESHCPQSIKIIDELKNVTKLLDKPK